LGGQPQQDRRAQLRRDLLREEALEARLEALAELTGLVDQEAQDRLVVLDRLAQRGQGGRIAVAGRVPVEGTPGGDDGGGAVLGVALDAVGGRQPRGGDTLGVLTVWRGAHPSPNSIWTIASFWAVAWSGTAAAAGAGGAFSAAFGLLSSAMGCSLRLPSR